MQCHKIHFEVMHVFAVTVDTRDSATQQSSNNSQTTTPADDGGRLLVFPDTLYSSLSFCSCCNAIIST